MKPLVNAPLIREHPLARGMQLGYVFNEGAGRRLNDVTGRYPATLTNFTFTSSSGWSGSASGGGVRFDGSNDYAQVLTRPILNGRRNATVAARLKVFGSFSALQFIYAENISAGVVFGLYITTSAQFGVYVFNGADNICLSSTNAVAGREYDIVGEWDVSQPALRIYVNGVLENTLTSWSGTFFSGINSVRIGGSTNVGSYPLNGILSHVYAYDTLLGASGAKALRADPYQMFDRSPASGIWVPSVYTQNLTLTAETGVFSLAGQDANLTPALLLDAETGQFTVAGQDADLIVDQGGRTLNLAPGKPRQVRYSARINGELVTGTYEQIQALILRIAEQEAEKAADEAIKEAKKPKRAPFLRILPGKPVEKTEEVEPERIIAKPLVTEYEDAYRRFLDKLISERLAAQIAAEMDDEEALLLLL